MNKKLRLIYLNMLSGNGSTLRGTCGDTCNYDIDIDTKRLLITGTGAVDVFEWFSITGFNYATGIEKVIISEGITRLEDNCFKDCSSLKSIVIPSTMQYIGNYAIEAQSLEEIYLYGDSELEEAILDEIGGSGKESIIPHNGNVYIKKNTLDNYSNTWKTFFNNIDWVVNETL